MPGPYNVQVGDVITTGQYLTDGQGNTSGLAIKSDGNVGIGTTNPAGGHLQVEGSKASYSGYFYNTNTADGDGLRIRTDYQSANSVLLNIENAGLDLLQVVGGAAGVGKVLVPNGDVGIGTISPGAKLEINGQIKITGGVPGTGKVLTSDANGLATWETNSPSAAGGWTDGGTTVRLTTSTARVGIGTSTADEKLHLAETNDDCGLVIDTYDDGASCSRIFLRKSDTDTIGSLATTDVFDFLGRIDFFGVNAAGTPARDETSSIMVQQRGNAGINGVPSRMEFHTSNGANGLELRMIVGEQGFVSIGVDPPTERLDINGRLRLRQATNNPTNNGTIWFDGTNLRVRLGGFDRTIQVS